MKKITCLGLTFALWLTTATTALAQKELMTIDPTAPQVSYATTKAAAATEQKANYDLLDMVKIRSRRHNGQAATPAPLKEHRASLNNLLQQEKEPIHITPEKLQKARAQRLAKNTEGSLLPNNNHKHLIVNVIYNSLDETKEGGIYAIDVETGELTCLVPDFEGMEHEGFNGGGYVFNGKYRGVFYEQGTTVSRSNLATVLEYNMDDWTLNNVISLRYMTSMALEVGTQYNADGTTTVVGEFWGIDGQGNLSLRYATFDDDGLTTTSFGKPAKKHMVAMGVTSDGRLYGVAKDGNLYQIDRSTSEEILVGHTGIDDIVDYEGHFWLQAGEIDPRDDTFYWMAEHASVYWTELCKVDLATGKATVLVDFQGDVECAGMVIAPQQKKDDTPESVTDLTATFAPLQTTGSGSFTAPTKSFDGKTLAADATLYYHLYVNGVEELVANHQATPGETVNFSISANNVKNNAENTIKVTVANGPYDEESLAASATAWVGYGIPEAPKNVAMQYDQASNTVTISWEAPTKGDNAGVKGGSIGTVNYFVWRMADGIRTSNIHGGRPLPENVNQLTYTIQGSELQAGLTELSFAVEAWSAPTGYPIQGLASEVATTDGILIGQGKSVPYTADIANDFYNVAQSEFLVLDENNDGKTWGFVEPHYSLGNMLSGAVVCNNYTTSLDADDWLVLPGIALKAGKTYHFRSNMHGPSATSGMVERLEVKAGTSKTAEAMTVQVLSAEQVVDYCMLEGDFTVPEDGNYFIGLHAVSPAAQWEIAVFDITIEESKNAVNDPLAPMAGTVEATPIYGITEATGEDGNTVYYGRADIKVTLPTTKQDGTALAADERLTATLLASNGTTERELTQWTNQEKGAELLFNAQDLTSGDYTFTVQTAYTANGETHTGRNFSATAYVGWDNTMLEPTGMTTIQTADKIVIRFPEQQQLKGTHGAYLPYIVYQAYSGDKAATISRALAAGYTDIFTQISADAETEAYELEITNVDPQKGGQYNWGMYVVALSRDAAGNLINSGLHNVRTVVGMPLQAPAIETGEQTYLIDAQLDEHLDSTWTYYLNRGDMVCGIQPIEDQFGHDAGKTWDVFSAFNGNLSAFFAKVDISTLATPVFDFDLIIEDPETAMTVVLNGPDGQQKTKQMTVQDGMQHISIDLSDIKSWGWVQPTLVITYKMAEEGYFHDVFFDNVTVFDALPQNLAIIDFEVPAEIKSGEVTMANVTLMNMGQQDMSNYTVTLTEDEVEVQSQTFSKPLKSKDIQVVQFRYAANTVNAYDKVGQEEAEKVLVATVKADGDGAEADNSAEAVTTITVAGGKDNSSPSNVVAQTTEDGGPVSLTWSFDFEQTTQMVTEDFEGYERWSVGGVKAGAQQGQIGVWRLFDGDNKPTYTWQNFEYVAQNVGEPQAFQVFSGEVFNSDYYTYDMSAMSGSQYLVSMDPADGNYAPMADDYLISPLVKGGTAIEFYYGSLVDSPQGVEVLYSETDQDVSHFIRLQTLTDATSSEWYQAYVKLPQNAKYFAIHHTQGSYMGYGIKLDDITYAKISSVDHFNIYLDEKLVGTSNEASYTIDTPLEGGNHRIAVTAVYADGAESVPAYATFATTVGISETTAADEQNSFYSVDGKRLTAPQRGVNIIRQASGKTKKIVVR